MSAKDDAWPNMQWQWVNCRVDTYGAEDKQTGEPNMADSVNFSNFRVLRYALKRKPWALAALCHGQRHNPPVQDHYRRCYEELGSDEFWLFFATASYEPTVNWAAVDQSLTWQRGANPGSIDSARAWLDRWSTGFEARDLVAAVYNLMVGQSHNEDAMSNYRTAARLEAFRLALRVQAITDPQELITPDSLG